MRKRLFFPGGRTMSNSDIGQQLTLNNCFVAPQVPDSLEGIFDTIKLGALTHQRGGGIGYDFSQLRPKGTPTSNDAIASGPVSFASVFNAQTATILQGNRRGANMGILNIYHPDIEDFIDAKSYETKTLEHFNLSVMVDDKFMNAMLEDKKIILHWPVYDDKGHIENNPSKWKITKNISAKKLWDKIMRKAYENGEPGIFFYNTMNRDNNLHYAESIIASNPCAEYLSGMVYEGELSSSEYGGACNLGSLVLHNFVTNPFTEHADIDYSLLTQTIHTAVRFLDNIIDINIFPSKIYENYQKTFRTIGLGYTGLADMLVMLNLKYNSNQAREFVHNLTDTIAQEAYKASIELAKEKGHFPAYSSKILESGFLQKHHRNEWQSIKNDIVHYGIRNAKIQSVAPCGTMSLVFGQNCSSGIEPIFSLSYDRKIKIGGQQEKDEQIVTIQDYALYLFNKLKSEGVNVISNPPFITALDISVEDHVNMLAEIAFNVDMSVSKTINVPTDYPFEDCKKIYEDCWRKGIKGCTIFRPNPIRQGILITPNKKTRGDVIKCTDDLIGIKRKVVTGCGTMHILAWYDPDTKDILEVFLNKGSSGGCEKNLVAMARLISLSLRGGVPFDKVIDQLESCGGCSAYQARRASQHDTSPGSSCATAVAKALVEIYNKIHDIKEDNKQKEKENMPKCPECGSPLIIEGGCNVCKACGWSKCG